MNDDAKDGDLATIEAILSDPAASLWLRAALRSALSRDPVDTANDAHVLEHRCRSILKATT
jgi:hypothetical protein